MNLDLSSYAAGQLEMVVALRGGDWDRLRLARARGGFAPGEALPRTAADRFRSPAQLPARALRTRAVVE